jgi:TonB family protein
MVAAPRRDAELGVHVAVRLHPWAVAVLLVSPAPARAQAPASAPESATAPPSASAPESAPAELVPPRARTEVVIAWPADQPGTPQPVVVRVKLRVGPDGRVRRVTLTSDPQPPFDALVVAATTALEFEPATYGGKPVPVEIDYTHTFLPPPPAPAAPSGAADTGPALDAELRGKLVEMGTGLPVQGATVVFEQGDRHYQADADTRGRFVLPVPAGDARVTVHAAGYRAFLQTEHVDPRQALAVTYAVERERYDPYEIQVVGDPRREETSRITLKGAELKQVPGTFGDPFRVVQALPGVASVVSLLPFPVVRGASPSSTGFLIDGTRVPLLYHLLAGPSVIHPELIDEVQFYPGGAPVPYGGYTAGIVDGLTHRAGPQERLIDIDLNLLQTGGLIRWPVGFLDGTVTAAARVGYPGVILSLATNEASLSYWDYQLRFDHGTARDGLTVFVFGARDTLETPAADADPADTTPPLEPSLILGFHRLDVRLRDAVGDFDAEYRIVTGFDETLTAGTDVQSFIVEPRFKSQLRLTDTVTLAAGLEGGFHETQQSAAAQPNDDVSLTSITGDLSRQMNGSAWLETLWRPNRDWLVRPGARTDVWYDHTDTRPSVDPRVLVRYRLFDRDLEDVPADSDDRGVWVKGGAGVFHQPPRFFLPLPGLDQLPLEYGLLTAYQTSFGLEVPLDRGFNINIETYYDVLDPVVFDLSVNQETAGTLANETLLPQTTDAGESRPQQVIDRLIEPQSGRAYGVETMLRRTDRSGGPYGWISYTLSRSERKKDGVMVPYDFDRTHLVNVVAGLPLPRNWDLSLRLQYQSGKPATTTAGYNAARIDGYTRVDLRVDKRAVWMSWLLDFYIDVTNVALFPEEVSAGNDLRYVLPTVGLRGRL